MKTISRQSLRTAIAFAVLGGACIATVQASPLSYTGGTYTQDFDGLPTNVTNASQALPAAGPYEFSSVTNADAASLTGWQIYNARSTSGSGNLEFKSQNGSLTGSAGRGIVSYGANGSTDRALGSLSTSNQVPDFGIVITNNTGHVLTSFSLSYTGEQWSSGTTAGVDTLAFYYGLGSSITSTLTSYSPLSFTEPHFGGGTALDGNDTANQQAVSGTVVGLNWAPGQDLVLRWNTNELSGSDNGLAIDNLSFSAVPEPSSVALAAIGLGGCR